MAHKPRHFRASFFGRQHHGGDRGDRPLQGLAAGHHGCTSYGRGRAVDAEMPVGRIRGRDEARHATEGQLPGTRIIGLAGAWQR